jgi:hypothetical protein
LRSVCVSECRRSPRQHRLAIASSRRSPRNVEATDFPWFGETHLRAPVAFFVFNRPDTTIRVFEAIAATKPPKLLVVADGPRRDRTSEAALCRQVRSTIERVDWDCEVLTNFSDENLGCRQRIATGLDWVFQTVEEAVVLEDDCLPHPSFFEFCDELLERYRDDERVMGISGDNFQPRRLTQASYYFSRFTHVWGWATWRRAWRHYDERMRLWPAFREARALEAVVHPRSVGYWSDVLNGVYENRIDTWDYQWTFACWTQGGLTILPAVNLVSNIGFRTDATHTTAASALAELPAFEMPFPLTHPSFVLPDLQADLYTQRSQYRLPSRLRRFAQRLRRLARTV